MKKFLHHLAFIVSMASIYFAFVNIHNGCVFCRANSDVVGFLLISFTLLILLWKNNYFTRNKS